MADRKKRFGERPPSQRAVMIAITAIGVALVGAAERDIQGRPAQLVRGNKLIWRLLSLNALGALSYFRWGRVPRD